MIELIVVIIILIFAAMMMRGRSIVNARVDLPKRRTAALDNFHATTAPAKNTKIKWKPQVRVREYYKDGSVADVAPRTLEDAV